MVTVQIVLVLAAFAAVSFVILMFNEMEWRRWLGFVLFCLGVSAFGLWITYIAEPIAILGWLLAFCAPMFFGEWVYKQYKARNGGSKKDIALCQRLGVNPMMIRFGYTGDIDGTWYKMNKRASSTTLRVEMLNDDELWFYHIKEQEMLKMWEQDFNDDENNSHPYPEDYTALHDSTCEIKRRNSFRLHELIELYSQRN